MLTIFLPSCKKYSFIKTVNISQLPTKQRAIYNPEQIWITVWVHGTFFFTNRVIPQYIYCPKGLHPLSSFAKNSYQYNLAKSLYDTDNQHYNLDHFYIFGWSGKLSFLARAQAAQELYIYLISLIKKYENTYNKRPHVRIITHSHGGNVVLNMAKLEQKNLLSIDELILLACPVQEETKANIAHPMFKKIISFYSRMDIVQILDPQGMYPQQWHAYPLNQAVRSPLFSQRIFEPCQKLTQVKLKKNHRGLFHIEFMLPRFLKLLPNIVAHI